MKIKNSTLNNQSCTITIEIGITNTTLKTIILGDFKKETRIKHKSLYIQEHTNNEQINEPIVNKFTMSES